MIRRRFELPGIAPRKNARSGWRALRVGRIGVKEQNALAGQPVKVRRLDPPRAIRARVPHVIGDGKEDVGARGCGAGVGLGTD